MVRAGISFCLGIFYIFFKTNLPKNENGSCTYPRTSGWTLKRDFIRGLGTVVTLSVPWQIKCVRVRVCVHMTSNPAVAAQTTMGGVDVTTGHAVVDKATERWRESCLMSPWGKEEWGPWSWTWTRHHWVTGRPQRLQVAVRLRQVMNF